MAPLPLVNLGFLVIKQVSKPFAKFIAAEAKEHKIFKDWICIPIAQRFHFLEVVVKMRSLKPKRGSKGSGSRVTKVPALNHTIHQSVTNPPRVFMWPPPKSRTFLPTVCLPGPF